MIPDFGGKAVLQYKYLEQENQLLIVGWRHIQLLDLTNFKTIETRPLAMPVSDRLPGWQDTDGPISPDGRRLLLLGLGQLRTKTKTETKQAASVLDLKTGKRIALLDSPESIRSASWSKNGLCLKSLESFLDTVSTGGDSDLVSDQHAIFLSNFDL